LCTGPLAVCNPTGGYCHTAFHYIVFPLALFSPDVFTAMLVRGDYAVVFPKRRPRMNSESLKPPSKKIRMIFRNWYHCDALTRLLCSFLLIRARTHGASLCVLTLGRSCLESGLTQARPLRARSLPGILAVSFSRISSLSGDKVLSFFSSQCEKGRLLFGGFSSWLPAGRRVVQEAARLAVWRGAKWRCGEKLCRRA